MTATATKIAELNDALRTTFSGGKVVFTQGIKALDETIQSQIVEKIQTFNDFSKDNDPYKEHDFGSFKQDAYTINWKIDYYDLTFKYGSEAPENPAVTRRVLTIMRSDEY